MKRDMDLVRKILLEVETLPYNKGEWSSIEIEGYSNKEISYHIKIMTQAGLLDANNLSVDDIDWFVCGLTWEGHEFLDSSREESIWKKAKTVVLEKCGNISFELLKSVLLQLAKQNLSGFVS
jgi:hypothetical protein